MVAIRQATPADMPAILVMAERFYRTTSYAAFADFDPESVEAIAAVMIEAGVMLLAVDGDEPVGMVGLLVGPFLFNRSLQTAHEVVWWVNPEAQGAGAGKALLAAIEPACGVFGVAAIQMMHMSNSPPQAAAIYERMGYAHSESSYTKVI